MNDDIGDWEQMVLFRWLGDKEAAEGIFRDDIPVYSLTEFKKVKKGRKFDQIYVMFTVLSDDEYEMLDLWEPKLKSGGEVVHCG